MLLDHILHVGAGTVSFAVLLLMTQLLEVVMVVLSSGIRMLLCIRYKKENETKVLGFEG